MASTFTPKQLYQGIYTSTVGGATLIYRVPTNTIAMISNITICNVGSTNVYASVHMSNLGVGATISTAILYQYQIPANSPLNLSEKRILGATGTIHVDAGTTAAITFTVDGAEVSLA